MTCGHAQPTFNFRRTPKSFQNSALLSRRHRRRKPRLPVQRRAGEAQAIGKAFQTCPRTVDAGLDCAVRVLNITNLLVVDKSDRDEVRASLKRAKEFKNGPLIGSRQSLKTVSRFMGFLTMPQNRISHGG